jgi:hypothetical protein
MALLEKFLNPSLFKPKWQHKDAEVRKQALENLTDEKLLVQIANQDSDKEVRLLALSKIQSKQHLAEFLVCEQNDLRKQAQQQHLGQLLPNQNSADLAAIDNDNDLVSIATYTQDETIRLAAINKLSDENIRLDIACHNPVAKVRMAAAQGIVHSDALNQLMQVAQGKDKALYRFCKDQLGAAKAKEDAIKAEQDKINNSIASAQQLAKSAYSPEYNGRLQLLKQTWSSLSGQNDEQNKLYDSALADAEKTLSAHLAEEQAAQQQRIAITEAKETFATVLEQLERLEFNQDISVQLKVLQQDWQQAKQVCQAEAEQNKTYENSIQTWLALDNTRAQLDAQADQLQDLIKQSQSLAKTSLSKSQSLQKELTQTLKQLPWKPAKLALSIATPELLQALDQALQVVIKHNQNLTAHEADSAKQLVKLLEELSVQIEAGHLKEANKCHQQAVQALKKISQQESKKYQRQFQSLTAKLTEIRDWQGYAATPKKEALVDSMEALIGSEIDPSILADKIHDLQEEWKTLGPIARQDDKILWNRFRAAADKAYEPCKAHYAEMANQRQQNLANRQTLIAQLTDYEANMDWDNADWAVVQKTLDAARASFRSFSPVDRHEHKNSQAQLQEISDKIYAHIKAEYQTNIEAKEALIAKAVALKALEDLSQAIEQSKQLQASWKTVGMTPNKADQKLWQEFRLACDAVFARRDEQRQQNKAQIEASIEQAEEIVKKAESLVQQSSEINAAEKQSLQEYLDEFSQLSLPKAVYSKLRKRLADVQQAQEDALRNAKLAKKQQAWNNLSDKLLAISCKAQDSAKAEALFKAQEAERKLPQGIDKAAINNKWQGDASSELSTSDALRDACIGLEILAELDSPAQDQQARMAYQVQRLSQGLGQAGSLEQQIADSVNQWLALNANEAWQQRYNQALLAAAKQL